MFSPHDLASDLYSAESPSSQGTPQASTWHETDPSLVPDLQLTNASLDLEKGDETVLLDSVKSSLV